MRHQLVQTILADLEQRLLGKHRQLEYALACLLARGHLLIEDVPGVGKTTLAKSLASSFDVGFRRIQFTSDLLPSDLIGVTVYKQREERFAFQQGPIFTHVLLADEINRANPKTQSALLEAMHENQISHDSKTYTLPAPFFVIATQNSKDHYGTFPLPESQLDRFLMRLSLGYPSPEYEIQVIRGDYVSSNDPIHASHKEDLISLQQDVDRVRVADEVVQFIYQIVQATRDHDAIHVGVSPRGAQSLYRAIRALAFVRGRDYCVPDDVRELAAPVCGHRILMKTSAANREVNATLDALFDDIMDSLSAPV